MTLLIMAAGMGSRYGGIKQIEPVGEKGELIIDYSIHDAIKSGFKKIIFIIRRDIEKDFREKIYDRFCESIKGTGVEAKYVFQDMPAWRKKPLGTTDAILAAKNEIDEPFCVINADDFYGREAFEKAKKQKCHTLVAYHMTNTLSENGAVKRAVIKTTPKGYLKDLIESQIERADVGKKYPRDTRVSMNFFVFQPSVLPKLEKIRDEFLKTVDKNDEKTECLLPENIAMLIKNKQMRVKVVESGDKWLGLTYKDDKPLVVAKIKELVQDGVYSSPLWGNSVAEKGKNPPEKSI
jgi:NDP-sugar pyrophosphorylase family protein